MRIVSERACAAGLTQCLFRPASQKHLTVRLRHGYFAALSQPPFSGWGADGAGLMKSKSHVPRCIIIAITGHTLSGVKESCRDAGMNDFLTKPVSLDDLKGAITRTSDAAAAVAKA